MWSGAGPVRPSSGIRRPERSDLPKVTRHISIHERIPSPAPSPARCQALEMLKESESFTFGPCFLFNLYSFFFEENSTLGVWETLFLFLLNKKISKLRLGDPEDRNGISASSRYPAPPPPGDLVAVSRSPWRPHHHGEAPAGDLLDQLLHKQQATSDRLENQAPLQRRDDRR